MDTLTHIFVRMGSCLFLSCCIWLSFGSALSAGETAPEIEIQEHDHKIRILAVRPEPDRTFDVDLVPAAQGVVRLKAALNLIRQKSPVHSRAIDRIKEKGEIYLIYNPNYPGKLQDLAQVRVALFLPFYLSDETVRTETPLPVIISRHGIKWPTEELAAVIVHELVGHAQQYLNGQTNTLRTSELECQAWLHQELAHQVFGLDKSREKMIRFRQQLGGYGGRSGHCSPFLRYLRKHQPDDIRLYERLNPDVPALLALLDDYIEVLAASGTTQKALAFKQEEIENRLKQVKQGGTPDQLYAMGMYLLEGAGFYQDVQRGAGFIRLAAEKNEPRAQYQLARLYAQGRGVAKHLERAYFWLQVAHRSADTGLRQKILAAAEPLTRNLPQSRVSALKRSADQWVPGHPLPDFPT